MTNDEMRNILERGLGIPIKESDAAWVLSVVEEKLRNEPAAQQARAVEAERGALEFVPGEWTCPRCGFFLIKSILYSQDMSTSRNVDPTPEDCLNCGVSLARVKTVDALREARDQAAEMGKRAEAAEQRAAELAARIVQLREALMFYDAEKKCSDGATAIEMWEEDGYGNTARAALAASADDALATPEGSER